jgi:hypothetical protein
VALPTNAFVDLSLEPLGRSDTSYLNAEVLDAIFPDSTTSTNIFSDVGGGGLTILTSPYYNNVQKAVQLQALQTAVNANVPQTLNKTQPEMAMLVEMAGIFSGISYELGNSPIGARQRYQNFNDRTLNASPASSGLIALELPKASTGNVCNHARDESGGSATGVEDPEFLKTWPSGATPAIKAEPTDRGNALANVQAFKGMNR